MTRVREIKRGTDLKVGTTTGTDIEPIAIAGRVLELTHIWTTHVG